MRATLSSVVRPRATDVPWWELSLVAVTAFLLAYFRLGAVGSRGVLWAEDGVVYLSQAYRPHGFLGFVLAPYQGYAQLVPRLVTWFVVWLPLSWHGPAICASAAGLEAAVAAFAYSVVRAHTGDRLGAIIVAGLCAAMPTGPETYLSLANIQWYLLFAGCLAPLVQPRGRLGYAAGGLAVFAATTSSPFGALCLAIAVGVAVVVRTRDAWLLAAVSAAGVAVQGAVMLTGPPRSQPITQEFAQGFGATAAHYYARVLVEALAGMTQQGHTLVFAAAPRLGMLLLVGGAALVAIHLATRQRVALVVPTALALASAGLYFVLMWLSGAPSNYFAISGRYYVTPALLLGTAFALLTARGVRPRTRRLSMRIMRTAGIVVVIGVMAHGLYTSYTVPDVFGREVTPSWQQALDAAKHQCPSANPANTVRVPISPANWYVTIPCTKLLGH